MEDKCLEPKRVCCNIVKNKSYSEGTGKFIERKINDKETIKEEILKYHIVYENENCPKQDICPIKNKEYRKGISFITKTQKAFDEGRD